MNSEGSTLSAFDIIVEENCPTAPPGKQGSDAPTGKTPNAGTRREKQPALKVSKVKKASKSAETITSNTMINEESSKTSKGFDELSHKIDQLTAVVGNFAPVIAELKAAYDAGLNEDSPDDSEDDNGVVGEPPAKMSRSSSDNDKPVADGLVDVLVQEVTEDEQTGKALNEKIAQVLDNILASGLSEHVLTKRKEDIKRPENCKLLRVTKVNTEIWDIAQKTTRSMDARIQKLQETLIKGLTPLAYLTGKVGETVENQAPLPAPEEIWESLTRSVLLIAAANHELNMCRRDLFKVDLDTNYKTICSSKEPVGSELFGDDLTERLKTVKESKKAAQQLTKQRYGESSSKSTSNSRRNFLSHRRGRANQGRSHKRGQYSYPHNYYQKEVKSYQSTKATKPQKQK